MKLRNALIALGLFATLSTAQAALIPLSAEVAASPATAGTGLNAAYWNTNTSVWHNSEADAASTGKPTATFTAKVVDYTTTNTPSGIGVLDSTTLKNFLGNNGSNLSGAGSNTLEASIYRFTGYINITAAMDNQAGNSTIDVNFRVGSDDGMRLRIGGVEVTAFDVPRAYAYSNGTASFASAGLYAVDLLFWENYGYTGVDMAWQTGKTAGFQDVPTADLYSAVPAVLFNLSAASGDVGHVPEPTSLALVGLGFLLARRARKGLKL